jgi:glucose-6-phosphate 1-epimerase
VGTHLVLELVTRNLDKRPFEITSALHSYLAVSDISQVHVNGLDGTRCFDKVTGEEYTHSGLLYIDRETDRVFQDVRYPLFMHDKDRMLSIEADGSRSAVVWNPWRKKSAAMADMPDDGYRTMLCIEAANVMDDSRVMEPEKEHSLKAVLTVL